MRGRVPCKYSGVNIAFRVDQGSNPFYMEVPLMSKWAASARQTPPGHSSVMTTVAGCPEHAGLLLHLTCVTRAT